MPNSRRTKGFGYEREIVQTFNNFKLKARRIMGSDGRNAGLPANVDMIAYIRYKERKRKRYFQLKRRKVLPKILKPDKNIFGQIVRQDHGESYIIISLRKFLELVGEDDI